MIFICVMVFIAGFVDSVAGGGGLISLPAYMLAGLPAHQAYGTNKFSSALGTTLSVFRFFVNGALNLKVSLLSALGAFLGSWLGSRVVLLLDDHFLKMMMVFMLPIVILVVIFKKDCGERNEFAQIEKKKVIFLSLFIGLIIGLYDGLFGPGTGTFAIIAYTAIMKFDLKTASGNAKILNLASNYASVITFALSGSIVYKVALPAAVCGIVGNYLGSGLAIKKGAKFIRPMMVIVVMLLLSKIIIDLLRIY